MQFKDFIFSIVASLLMYSSTALWANGNNLFDIKATPTPEIDTNPICSGQKLTLKNKSDYLGKNVTFHWEKDGSYFSNVIEPVIRLEGSYSVYVQDSTTYSTPADIRNVTFFRTLTPLILASDTLKYCDGKTAPPINISGFTVNVDTIITYQDAALNVILRKDAHSPLYIDVASPAKYYFYFVKRDTDGCESSSKELTIIKNPRPVNHIFASDTFNCTITLIVLDASTSDHGAAYNFSWLGPGLVSGTGTLKPTINKPGTYKLTNINIVNGCNKTDSIVINPFVLPAVGVPKNNVNVCDSGLFNLYGLLDSYTPGGHWLDDDATGRITGQHYFSASGAAEGFYNFTYKQDSINLNCKGGTAKCKFQLLNYKDPGSPVLANICNTESSYNLFNALAGNDNGGVWRSSLSSSLLSGSSFQASGAAEGNYVFTYAFQPAGLCATDTTNVTIHVFAMKNLGTGINQTICSTEPYNLFNAVTSADRGGLWTDVQSTGRLADSVFDPREIKGGVFAFSYTFSGSPCPLVPINVTITTDIIPPVINCAPSTNLSLSDFEADEMIAPQNIDSVLIQSVSDNCNKFRLYNSVNNDSTLAGVQLPKSLGSIIWTVIDNGLNQTTCETKIRFITIPNIFTPNGDGHNDTWDFAIENNYPDASVLIFDRWGNKVWESDKGYHIKWDGGNAPAATYRYIIMNGKSFVINGFVNLVR
jgi:gliding motility-associated-like protein